jgi:hypothetical protein
MASLIKKIISSRSAQRHEEREAELYRALIRREAKIGGELFGPVPEGTRREFFCLDEHTWVWHEEWTDQNGQRHIRTTRYDVRPDGILKAQDGQSYQRVSRREAERLQSAVHTYNKRIRSELYAAYL